MSDTTTMLCRSQLVKHSIVPFLLMSCFALWMPHGLLAAPAPTVTRGPYLQMGTPTSIVLRWRTSATSDSRVCYGAAPLNLSTCIDVATKTTEHTVTLSGLTSNTTYYYSVGMTTQTLAGGDLDHFFVTSPEPGTARPTRIWVIGDSGTANNDAREVRDRYLEFTSDRYTDLWLMLGDNAYNSGTDTEYQAAVFDAYRTLLRQTVLWPSLGNHDTVTADSATQSGPYFDMFSLPTQGEAGGFASGTEAYYSFDFGNIHFIVLDSDESGFSPTGPMMTWLENDLKRNTQPWIIAYWHHPPYSRGSKDEVRERALPILETYGVDLVLSGHSHSYQRSFLIDGHYGTSDTFTDSMKKDGGNGRDAEAYQKSEITPVPHEGTVYVVAGSSGRLSDVPLNYPAMFISLNVLGSMVLDVNGNRLDAVFLDSTGAIRDYFSIVKGTGSPGLPTVTITAPDSTAAEAGLSPGSFLLSRTGSTSANLTVNYTIGGTATNGSDYQSLSGSVTIPPGSTTATITVTPNDDSAPEGNETVIATLNGNAAYTIGAPSSATVTITDNDINQAPIVSSGPDQTLAFPASASLDGTVRDDGLPKPPGAVTTKWSQVSGPGTVTFGGASLEDTTASFSQSGTYVLRLTADDGALSSSDDVKIILNPASNADLTITSLSAPSKTGAGSTISVTDTTKNAGSGSAGTSTTNFYLSNNKAFDAGDLRLGSRPVASLAAGEKQTGATSITIPKDQTTGSYYIIAVADATDAVLETKETNNTLFRALTIN
jgi:hypothetical protein